MEPQVISCKVTAWIKLMGASKTMNRNWDMNPFHMHQEYLELKQINMTYQWKVNNSVRTECKEHSCKEPVWSSTMVVEIIRWEWF